MEFLTQTQDNLVDWLKQDDPLDEYFATCEDGDCLSPWKMVLLRYSCSYRRVFIIMSRKPHI